MSVAARRREARYGRYEKGGSAGHRNALEELAAFHIEHWPRAVFAQIDQIGLAEFLNRKRQKSRIRRKIEARNNLRTDLFLGMSALFEKLEYASRRRIEQVNAIEGRVIDEHLLVQRVLEETGSYTRECCH